MLRVLSNLSNDSFDINSAPDCIIEILLWMSVAYRDYVAAQSVGCICTLDHGTELGVTHPCLYAGGANRTCKGRQRQDDV